MHKLFNIKSIITFTIVLLYSTLATGSTPKSMMGVMVFAGNDTVICQASTLPLQDLNATITGDVTDGYWFTKGDGFFDPGGMNNVLFSIGNSYIPGPGDIVAGHFDLILVSFDPDGNGPESQVKDTIRVTLQTSPALACHGSLNISLGNNCTELVTPQMLLTSPVAPYSQYTVVLTDNNGQIIPNNILTFSELEKNITFTVGHKCGQGTCWGTLRPQDKNPPVLQCANYTIFCDENTSPDSVGYPVTPNATITSLGNNKYTVKNLDACSDVTLNYSDEVQDMNCLAGLQSRIIRRWSANDLSSNSTTCTQVISIKTKGLVDIILPPHYNDTGFPSLECNGNWPQLSNGYPSPTHTGSPNTNSCKYLESTYTDITFDFCGNTYKLLRKWLIVDWCTNETDEYNQIIKIIDTKAPTFKVVDSLDLYTTAYNCFIPKTKLPLVTNIIDCSSVDTSFILRDTFNGVFDNLISTTKDSFYIDSLVVGYYIGSYILTDECGNKDTMSFPIKVMDNKAPFAICGQFVKISIISNGTARMFPNSLNDHSLDNCMIDSFSIAKMTDLCGSNANVFGKYVDFCCAETAAPVMVALKVTDIYGNHNTCMSEVTIEDKEKPVISCPSNVTIDCNFPLDTSDLSVFGTIAPSANQIKPFYINNVLAGTDGLATDNCMVSYDSTLLVNLNCNVGQIHRDFIASDLFGNKSSCRQTIQIINNDPFSFSDITWPANIELNECDTSNLDITITKSPSYSNVGCANVISTYEDQFFFNTNEACIKILRTWTVVDWCTYDSNTGAGLYNYSQFIKLNNSVLPVISQTCRDTTLCIINATCGPEKYTHTLIATDDCTPIDKLIWSWEIDSNNDGSIDHSGTTKTIDVLLSKGNHSVYVEVTDLCGNSTTCTYEILAKDCKKPTPYCVSNITTVIMPSTGQLVVKANSFDYNSFDNCTSQENLYFSFTSNKQDSLKTITCDDITNGVAGSIPLAMYVTDDAGNFDFCMVELTIQDNDDVCQDVGSLAEISGTVSTFNNKKVEQAIVSLQSDVEIYNQSKLTNTQGAYSFSSMPTGLSYDLSVTHQGPAKEALSTFDLILLQRHILSIEPLTSPYQILAGDANGSNKLNVSDLVAIRKVILGVTDSFGNDMPSWIFIDGNQEFIDEKNPWNYKEVINYDTLSVVNNTANFTAVKIGDINGSIGNIRSNDQSENRTDPTKNINVEQVDINKHSFSLSESCNLDGFQIALQSEKFTSIVFNPILGNNVEYFVDETGIVRIICYLPIAIEVANGTELFSIQAESITATNDAFLEPEIYIGNTVFDLALEKFQLIESPLNSLDYSLKYYNHQVTLSKGLEENKVMLVFSMDGKLVEELQINGRNQIPLTTLPGIYIISIQSETMRFNSKIFVP